MVVDVLSTTLLWVGRFGKDLRTGCFITRFILPTEFDDVKPYKTRHFASGFVVLGFYLYITIPFI